jgi:hypothetical protein
MRMIRQDADQAQLLVRIKTDDAPWDTMLGDGIVLRIALQVGMRTANLLIKASTGSVSVS